MSDPSPLERHLERVAAALERLAPPADPPPAMMRSGSMPSGAAFLRTQRTAVLPSIAPR